LATAVFLLSVGVACAQIRRLPPTDVRTASAESPDLGGAPDLLKSDDREDSAGMPRWSPTRLSRLESPSTGDLESPLRTAIGGEEPTPRLASYPHVLSQPILSDVSRQLSNTPGKVVARKDGFFQKAVFTGAWLARMGDDGLGMYELELYGLGGLPAPNRNFPLLITPGFEVRYLDGPAAPDLPPRVYDAYLELRWMGKFNDNWAFDFAVSPGVHSDFSRWENDAFRITGRVLGVYMWSERMKLALGVAYLDREDVSWIPAAGFIWTPTDFSSIELVFPRPRIAFRADQWYTRGPYKSEAPFEDWIYVAGEFGGGSWLIERTTADLDVATIRDYRLLLGIERKLPRGAGLRLEAGYVFGRKLMYESATPDFYPSDTILLRGGFAI
jgi:hypothetical protein